MLEVLKLDSLEVPRASRLLGFKYLTDALAPVIDLNDQLTIIN